MAKTVQQTIDIVRSLLQDTSSTVGAGYRYSDSDLARYISEGITEMRRLRPDIFYSMGLDATLPYYLMPADGATALPISDMFFTTLVNFVVGRAQLREDEFANDGRAVALLSAFGGALTANGGKQ